MNIQRPFVWSLTSITLIIVALGLITVCLAQSRTSTVTMKIGEIRLLDDGSKVGLTQGENGNIVVTITRPSADNEGDINRIVPPSKSIRLSRLRLGTYAARETIETIVSAMFGKGMQSYPTVKIKILEVDNAGDVTADFVRWDKVAHLTGSIDATGKLLLNGYLEDASGNEWKVTLTAVISGAVLSNGTYDLKTLNGVESRGVFKLAELQ